MSVGFIGCGTMGAPMARNLRDAGHKILCHDRRDLASVELHNVAESLAGIARACDVIFLMVRTADEIGELLFRHGNLSRSVRPGTTIIVSSTIALSDLRKLREQLRDDIILVDAPVSGAEPAAEAGTLTFMVGADPAVFEVLSPLFHAMGRHVTRPGQFGAGMAVKILNNYIHIATVVTVRQAIAWAIKNEIDPMELRSTLSTGSAQNWYLDHFEALPWSMETMQDKNHIPILLKDCEAALNLLEMMDPSMIAVPSALRSALQHV